MNTSDYLKRIHVDQPVPLDIHGLTILHQNHVYHVPFENLDVYFHRPFDMLPEHVFNKVVEMRRGGFCYELNLLFNLLLNQLGFSSRIIAARIVGEDGMEGPVFDHLALYVNLDKEYLVDVGFGDLFVTPMEIRSGVQSDGRNLFKIEKDEDRYCVWMSSNGNDFQKKYYFDLSDVSPELFYDSCLEKQTSPDSYFVKNVVCTIPTPTGRLTIFNDRFIERIGNERFISLIESDFRLRQILKDKFNISL